MRVKEVILNFVINLMALIETNPIIEDIIRTIEQMSNDEQKVLLAKLRLQNLLTGKRKPVIGSKNIKPLTLKEIDLIKHESRKVHARK